jgi:putative AdoMet-dependent methyltransferase
MANSRWQYDEMRQVGVDFESEQQVSEYDSRRNVDRGDEAALIARLGIMPGQSVVDLGCGTGTFAREAARTGARVHAVDVSHAMLDYLGARAEEEGVAGLSIERGGFLTFDAERHSVDVVVTRYALHHLPDFWKQIALVRIHDMLRSGGLLYLRDVAFSFPPAKYKEAIEHWIHRMPLRTGFTTADFETHVREEFSTFSWVLEGFLERAGFEIVERDYPGEEYVDYLARAV